MAEIYRYSSFSDKEEEVSEQIYLNNGGKIIHPIGDYVTRVNPNEVYTQLAKEGKFNELPSTCEFSEPVKLLVSNLYSSEKKEALIIGKLKDRFFEANFQNWQMAYTIQEPTEHKVGDVVEVESESFGSFFGMIHTINQRGVIISFGKQSGTLRMITDIKSIKKLK